MFCEDKSYAFVVVVFFFPFSYICFAHHALTTHEAQDMNKLHRFFKGYCYAAQKIKVETNAPKEGYLVFLFSSCQLQLKQVHDLSPAQESFLMFFKLSLQHLQLLRKKNKILWTKCANN